MPAAKKAKVEVVQPDLEWQYKADDGTWALFPKADADILEKQFQKKTKRVLTTEMHLASADAPHDIDMTTMTYTNTTTNASRPIRRLGNAAWEWKDDFNVFVQYYDEDNVMLERNWRKMTDGTGSFKTTEFSFNKGFNSTYTISVKCDLKTGDASGTQKNEDSGTSREIRRVASGPEVWDKTGFGISATAAPTAADVAAVTGDAPTSAPVSTVMAVPDYWEPQTQHPVQYFTLKEGSAEYKKVVDPFVNTLKNTWMKVQPKLTIHSVKRIQNDMLWKFYALTKHKVANQPGNKGDANEMLLFHGARVRQNMDSIVSFGFDMRVARNGSVGEGIYFAVNSSYSNGGYVLQNPDKSKEMFVCRVAVGSHCMGKHSLKRPPAKGKGKSDQLYDSVHNGSPISMHVVFDNSQAYPEYLIHYTQT